VRALSRRIQQRGPHLAAALGTARLVAGSGDDGADAVQEALLSAWQGLGSLRDPEAFPRSGDRGRTPSSVGETWSWEDTPRLPSGLVEELSELSRATGVAELRERLILDPPNPLATQVEFGADLLARPDPLVIEAEAEPQDPPFAPREGSGGVLGATATPRSTAPSTDALADPNSPLGPPARQTGCPADRESTRGHGWLASAAVGEPTL
jgi:hypothetical protein